MPLTQVICTELSVGSVSPGGVPLVGSSSALSTYAQIPLPVPGTLQNWHVRARSTLSAGQTRTLHVQKNGVTAVSSVALSDSVIEGVTATGVTLAAGDYINFAQTRVNNPGSQTIVSAWDWVPDDGESQIYAFATATPSTSVTEHLALYGADDALGTSSHASEASLIGTAGTFTGMACRVRVAAPGAGNSYTIVLVLNGVVQDGSGGTVDTRVIIADTNVQNNAAFTLPVVPGDLISVQITPAGGPALTNLGGAVSFVSDSPQVTQYGSTPDFLNTPGDFFILPNSTPSVEGATESAQEFIGGVTPITFTGIRVKIPAPGVGNSRTFTLRKNQSDTIITATISGTDTDGAADALVEVTSADRWTVKETVVGTANTGAGRFVLLTGPPVISLTGCVVIGVNTTVTATHSAAIGLDGDPHIHDKEGMLAVWAKIKFHTLPTSDPGVAGKLWNDAGTIKISAG